MHIWFSAAGFVDVGYGGRGEDGDGDGLGDCGLAVLGERRGGGWSGAVCDGGGVVVCGILVVGVGGERLGVEGLVGLSEGGDGVCEDGEGEEGYVVFFRETEGSG